MDAKWYRQLGARDARLRDRVAFTQEELAERAGITPSYLARIERGTRRPTLDVLGNIAAALDVPLARLLAEERANRAGEGQEGWGRSARQLAQIVLDLSDPDVDLLARFANRLRQR